MIDQVSSATLPAPVRELIARLRPDAEVEFVDTNLLGGTTYRLRGRDICYLKVAPDDVPITHDLTVEAERLRWIHDRFPVPEVLDAGRGHGFSWMLSAELAGIPVSDPRWSSDPRATAEEFGRAARAFHDALGDADQCPWSWQIAERLRAGTGSPEAVALLSSAPPEQDLVVCHGDLCAPNVLFDRGGRPAGVLDVGKLGVADRAADLGSAVWSLEFNGMADQVDRFLEAYGFTGDHADVVWYHDFYVVV